MEFFPERIKPEPYVIKLLRCGLDDEDFTTGYWAPKPRPAWIGYAFNQSPLYEFDEGAVIAWANLPKADEIVLIDSEGKGEK